MKFAVVGAGAIGAFVGAMLSKAGEEVTLIARGAHGRAMQERGVRVRGAIGEFEARPAVTDDLTTVGPVDVVLLTTKAHGMTELAPQLAPLLGPDTCVVPAQNGIPWWYFYRHGGEWEGARLETVDPGGVITEHLDPQRVVGCVVYCSTIIPEPGVILHAEGNRFVFGEPDGATTERCRRIAEAFIRAGCKAPIRSDIRHEIWVKLMGNVAFNPISALTGATMIDLLQSPETRALAREIMLETAEVAKGLGIELNISIEQRMAGAARVGHFKTSTLQDVEAGRPLEVEPMVGAVVELADKLGLSLPHTRSIYALMKLLDQTLQKRRREAA